MATSVATCLENILQSAKRNFAIVLLIAVAATGSAIWYHFAYPADPQALEPLVLGYSQNMPDIPSLIAEEKGFFREEGLDVRSQKYSVGKLALEALLRGEVDVATAAATPIVLQSLRTKEFVVIGQFVQFTSVELLTRTDTKIRTPSDLRGRRVGVMAGTSAQYFLETLLADSGIASADVEKVETPAGQAVDALVRGQVDAIAAFVPAGYYTRAALGDRAYSIPYDKVRYRESFQFVTRRDFPKVRAVAAQGLLRATVRAIAWTRSNRAEAIAIVTRRSKLDEKIVAELWDQYRLSLDLDQGLLGSLESQARWAIGKGLGRPGEMPNYLDFIDTSALQAVDPKAVRMIR